MPLTSYPRTVLTGLLLIVSLLFVSMSLAQPRVLVFSKTASFRHDSIESGSAAIQKLGSANGFAVDATEDAGVFSETNLVAYRAVVFLNTTGDVLDPIQQNAFERFIQAGGGYVGIHSAADTEYEWDWYGQLAGAYFDNHPNPDNVQQGTFHIVSRDFPGMANLPEPWTRTDEFYAFKQMNPAVNVLVRIDESTYRGGTNGDNHPMSWWHEYDGGRAFYTNMGHTLESFSEPMFLEHLQGGLQYAMGNRNVDFARARTQRMPEENRFTKEILGEKLDEPLELAALPDGRVLFVERPGSVRLYSPASNAIQTIARLAVSTTYAGGAVAEDGLLGVAAAPEFSETGWIYLYYSPVGDLAVNRLSRFTLQGDVLDLATEVRIIDVPVQRLECCHTGGSIAFDAAGNLYLSTGDNTNPHGTGYAPIDERAGREPWDAQKSSANTNDLRGKILRIHPEPDGRYTIPAGNLFPVGTPDTRPEIYTMGHRNPYRISVDKRSGFLYWGDVGPDASRDSLDRGPAGHDEFGQARQAGNFGWPYFTGDNKAYHDYDFTMRTPGAMYDAARPVNTSKNNTGRSELPPAQKAFIWYPAAASPEFPILGSGGRSAMAGPVFYAEDFAGAEGAYPAYYEGKLFIYEFMRGWIMAVTMDEAGDFVSMERFMPSYTFSSPLDLEFGSDGSLYMLEYGSGWFRGNDDARLVRISYNGGNRPPMASASADRVAGPVPFATMLSAEGSMDFDSDPLTYTWRITDAQGAAVQTLTDATAALTLPEPGVYVAELSVTDPSGTDGRATVSLMAGNEPPTVEIALTSGNQTFFAPGKAIAYRVDVRDAEDGRLADGQIAADQVAVSIAYQANYEPVATEQGHRGADAAAEQATGRRLIEGSDCRSCHGIDTPSIGPAYRLVAEKYKDNPGAQEQLAVKVLEGGSGAWGPVMMPPHPQFTRAEVDRMVAYILTLDEAPATASLPASGSHTPEIPVGGTGAVIIRAAYTDAGAPGVGSSSTEAVHVLRSPTININEARIESGVMRFTPPNAGEIVIGSTSGAHVGFSGIDLTDIRRIVFAAIAPSQGLPTAGGTIEVRTGSPEGRLIGTSSAITPAPGFGNPSSLSAVIEPTTGKQYVFFVFRNNKAAPEQPIMILLTATFESGEGSIGAAPVKGSAGLSTGSTIATLIAHPGAAEVLERHMPGFTTDPRLDQAMSMSIREIAPYASEVFTPELLSKLEVELSAL
ncbi:MAG: ThuA domain-containing protein [Rhodothermales bacterium]|nr:ThuA domain-containing protein [Rhodothermales bacterium]